MYYWGLRQPSLSAGSQECVMVSTPLAPTIQAEVTPIIAELHTTSSKLVLVTDIPRLTLIHAATTTSPGHPVVATTPFQISLGHPRKPSCYNPGFERKGFLSFLWMLGGMLFHSFHSGPISIISINPDRMGPQENPPETPQIFHFFHLNGVFHFFQGVGPLKSFISFISIVFFISFRVWDPQIFHFFHFFHFISFLFHCNFGIFGVW